jgi:hypothetical protein
LIAIATFMLMKIPESVIFLLEKHRFKEAKTEINYLMDFNHAKPTDRIECEKLMERFELKQNSLADKEK